MGVRDERFQTLRMGVREEGWLQGQGSCGRTALLSIRGTVGAGGCRYNGPHPKPGVTVAAAKLDPWPKLDPSKWPKLDAAKWPKLDPSKWPKADWPKLDPSKWPKLDPSKWLLGPVQVKVEAPKWEVPKWMPKVKFSSLSSR